MPPQNILISLRCAPLHQDILHRGLTNGSIQFILKKERERPISSSHHKVIFLQLIVFTEFFCRALLEEKDEKNKLYQKRYFDYRRF